MTRVNAADDISMEWSLRHHHHTNLLLAVHLHHHRFFKTDMTQELGFFHHRLLIQELLVVDTVSSVGIDGEIAYTERGQVLEEVGALTRIDSIIGQPGFYDHSRR